MGLRGSPVTLTTPGHLTTCRRHRTKKKDLLPGPRDHSGNGRLGLCEDGVHQTGEVGLTDQDSHDFDPDFVFVLQAEKEQIVLGVEEFAAKYKWKNVPALVKFTGK